MIDVFISKKIKIARNFKIDDIFNDYITDYNKKLDLYLVKCEFEVELINYTDFEKKRVFFKRFIVNMKNYSICHVYHVISGKRKFSHLF